MGCWGYLNSKDMKEIVGYPNYGYEDGKVWNTKTNKPLKGYVHYSVEYVNLRNNGKTKMYPVPKIAFCAIHHIPLKPCQGVFSLSSRMMVV